MASSGNQQIEQKISKISETLYEQSYKQLCKDNDKVFAVLLGLQWVAAIIVALVVSPRTWIGAAHQVNVHVIAAAVIGGLLSVIPIVLNWSRPGATANRYINVISQGLYSALFIHLTGGRIETHFHVFGSLAFFAFYRDIRVLLTGTVIVAVDHLIRGIWFPESAFGMLAETQWRWVEHAGWVVFEDFFLAYSCIRGIKEMKIVAQKQAEVMFQHEVAEKIVEERTAELRAERNELHKRNETIETIYSNVQSGFLLVDHRGIIQEGFTESCRKLIHSEIKSGMPLSQYMGMNERASGHFRLMIEQVFEDLLPEDLSLEQVPQKHSIGERFVRLEGSIVRDGTGAVRSILFTISDITDLQRNETQNIVNQSLIRILQQKSAFINFLTDTRKMLIDAKTAVVENDQKRLRFILHSIKGNASIFDLNEIVHLIHNLEDNTTIEELDVEHVETYFKNFLLSHQAILSVGYEQEQIESYNVSKSQLGTLGKRVHDSKDMRSLVEATTQWIVDLKRRPAKELLEPISKMGYAVAERLGKQVEIEIKNDTISVDAELLRPVIQNLSHLIRNSIDHGIELPEERGSKNIRGRIFMEVGTIGNDWVLIIADDGKGLDIDKITTKAIESGHLSADRANTMTEREKMNLIFLDGLSTSSSVTYLSGRGVGMSAVKDAITSIKGHIEVKSTPGKGTTFIIKVPADPFEAKRDFQLAANQNVLMPLQRISA